MFRTKPERRLLPLVVALVLGQAGGAAGSPVEPIVERPRVGLALAGGGAKGGAHVGVLKVLEELRVPIDYVAGTSIGAIVGGLYASGMSVEELESVLTTMDWDDLLRDKPARRDLSFRRKEDDARYLFDLELGVGRGGLEFPPGLISGQKLFFMLQALTLELAETDDFDDLPIPFRAIATDVRSGDMVVLGSGNLASAIRASMALPAIFSPVPLGGRLLVDGGIVNNVPVDIVREMGADVVIAVDLGAPLSARDINSFVEILSQTLRMLTRPNMDERLAQADLVLVPPTVEEFGTMAFDQIGEIIPLGAEAARAHLPALEALALDEESYQELRVQQRLQARPPRSVDFVRIEGNAVVDQRVIVNQMDLRPGPALDLDQLFADLNRVFGLGDFELIDYEMVDDREGHGIVVRTHEKPWGPNYLHFGLSLESDLDGQTDIGLLGNVTSTRLNRRGGEWRNELRIGNRRRLSSEFYQPLDFDGHWFIAPSVDLDLRRPGIFVEGRRVADLDVRQQTATLDIGFQFSKFAEVRLGVERGTASVDVATGALPEELVAAFDLDDIDFGGLSLEMRVDRLDSATFPRRGGAANARVFVSTGSLGADAEYDRYQIDTIGFASRGRHTVLGGLDAGWSPGGDLPPWAEFTLGGFASLSGFAEDELRGQYLGVVRAGYYYRLSDRLYVGGWGELGNVWQDESQASVDSAIFAFTALFGLDTIAGPVFLAFGQAEGGENKVYVSLGRTL